MQIKQFATTVMILSVLAVSSPALAESYTLEESLSQALENYRMVKAADAEQQAREYERRGMFGRFFPVLRAEVNAMLWDSDNLYNFDTSGFQQLFAAFPGGDQLTVPPMQIEVRDNLTIQTKLMAIQPLTQLYKVYSGHAALSAMAESARFDALNERRKVEREVTNAFFGYIGAQQMSESVGQALKQVEAYEKQTRDYQAAGLVEREALLKVLVQREELNQAKSQAVKGVKLSRAMLNMYMGRPLQAEIEAVCERCQNPETSLQDTLLNQQKEALAERPDLRSAREQSRAAASGRHAAIGDMLPELNLVGTYINNYGMGELYHENEFFGGLMLTWNFWEWGATYYKVKAAEARVTRAVEQVAAAEDGIRLEVQQTRLELEEAIQRYIAAVARLELAAESLRLEQNRYEAQQVSAADLVAAQTAELRARNDQTVAAMQVEVARRGLALAVGRDLLTEMESDKQ